MFEFILSLFKPRSVNAIVSDFTKAVEQLEVTRAHQLREAEKHKAKAQKALADSEAATTEAARALSIKNNINSLLG